MTTVDPISATSGLQTGSTTEATARKTTLDAEVFLKLLVTQLSNQDPSSPLNTNEMIAQTTQLASMEQLTSLTSTTSEAFALSMRQTAASLIGKQAQYIDEDGSTKSGLVASVSFSTGVPTINIGGTAIRLDAVTGLAAIS
ncbi:flagellar hook capping FlgD N-terminal domain-containing protein [Microbacterium sp. GXF7504]